MAITRWAVETSINACIEAASKANPDDVARHFPHSDRWISSLLLSHIFTVAVPAANLPVALQFVRRAEAALLAYSALAAEIAKFALEPGLWRFYFSALSQAEIAISSLYQARYLAAKKFDLQQFSKGDGSDVQRLDELYNAIKHIPAEDKEPVWLSDFRLESASAKLSYSEFEEILGRTAGMAQSISGI